MYWPNFSAVTSKVYNYLYAQPESSLDLKVFDCFKKTWEIPDFWKRANTSDACLAWLSQLLEQNPYDPQVRGTCQDFELILEKNLEYFGSVNLFDKWADDFGWWGLLGLNAHAFCVRMGNDNLAAKYLDLSCRCYDLMISAGYDHEDKAFPALHGCCNATIESRGVGVKNTVTNALLMLLSIKLYIFHQQHNLDNRERFLETAVNQWTWFSKWFELDEYAYLRHFIGDNEAALVCERPLAFVNGSTYQDKSNPEWTPNWVWTGDQGLLIGALINLAPYKNDPKIQEVAGKLVRGVQRGLIGQDGIFYEPPCISSFEKRADDYFGGRGILVRYMELQKIKELFGINFKENIVKTANALISTKVDDQFKIEFTDQKQYREYSRQFSLLWGVPDIIVSWNLTPSPQIKDPLAQAIGLDFLAAQVAMH